MGNRTILMLCCAVLVLLGVAHTAAADENERYTIKDATVVAVPEVGQQRRVTVLLDTRTGRTWILSGVSKRTLWYALPFAEYSGKHAVTPPPLKGGQ